MARRQTPVTGRHQPLATQAHREREQAQGTLGTADHHTRVPETGQSWVPHTRADGRRSPTGADDTWRNDVPAASLPDRQRPPWAPGSRADGTRHRARRGVAAAANGNVVPRL